MVKMTCMFVLLFNQKFKVMKNLMQKLVKTTLCLGVVSLTLVACGDDVQEDTNIITLDQLDSVLVDTIDVEPDTTLEESVDDENIEENVEVEGESVEKEEE